MKVVNDAAGRCSCERFSQLMLIYNTVPFWPAEILFLFGQELKMCSLELRHARLLPSPTMGLCTTHSLQCAPRIWLELRYAFWLELRYAFNADAGLMMQLHKCKLLVQGVSSLQLAVRMWSTASTPILHCTACASSCMKPAMKSSKSTA